MASSISAGGCLLLCAVALLSLSPLPSLAQDPPPTPNITHEAGHCLWLGQCGPSGQANGVFNCFYNGPARNVTPGSEFQKALLDICPQYANGPVCCDKNQLDTLTGQIGIPRQLLGRCPACLKNFINIFCASTCDPNASQFLDGKLQYDKDKKEFEVTSATVYLDDEYAHGVFNSCKNVINPQDNAQKVVDLMCNNADPCTVEAWFQYLGTGNPYVPFPMRYKFDDGSLPKPPGVVAYDATYYPCNYHNGSDYSLQCSCTDCGTEDVCPPAPLPLKNNFPIEWISIGIAAVGGAIVLIIFIITLIAGIIQLIRKPTGYSQIDGGRTSTSYGTMSEDDDDSPTSSVGSINDDLVVDAKDDYSSCCYSWYKFGAYFENWIKHVFYLWGKFATKFWYIVIPTGIVVMGVFASGMYRFEVVTDTVKLWSAPDSRARLEKNYFDENFGPFYRTEMIIVKPLNQTLYFKGDNGQGGTGTFGPAMAWPVLNESFHLQEHLINMAVPYQFPNGTMKNVTLEDICFKPLKPDNKNCTVMSVFNYFQNDYAYLSKLADFTEEPEYLRHMYYCTRGPASPSQPNPDSTPGPGCLGSFGGPVDPNVALGGFNYDEKIKEWNYQNATTLIITFTVNNHIKEAENAMAEAWEKAYLDYLKNYNGSTFNFSFLAERSTVDELERESQTDELTVVISYLFMFAYITLFLGHIRSVATILIDMKFFVGLVGVGLVLLAVVASIGLLSYMGVAGSLIILEVVPFLVLAVGVDNLFIIVHSYERQTKKFSKLFDGDLSLVPVPELIGRALGEVAPSLLLTSLSETAAFLLGGISTMPAVRSFSFYAGVAVFFNFMLQVTIFVSVVALDAKRQLANRFDILFCLKLKGKYNPNAGVDILHFIMKWFAKFILYPIVRPFVLLIFGATTVLSLISLLHLDIGLDQKLAFPKDSYLITYFNDMESYLHTGSPVYFVIKDTVDYSRQDVQDKICSQAGCSKDSLGTQISVYSEAPDLTRIAEPGMLWLDTYFQWLSPDGNCCGITNNTNDYCKNPGTGNCTKCPISNYKDNRPSSKDFKKYIHWWLNSNPGTTCPAGGHAAFYSAVKFDADNTTITSSYVMTYHTVLKSSDQYVDAIFWARRLSDNVTQSLNITVFPYSVFYVFYEQYLHAIHDMAVNLGASLGAVFLVTFLTMGFNLWAAIIIMVSVGMILIHMIGSMAVAGISANAISLVNLVMTVGISVEFCSHMVRWFTSCPLPSRYLRAKSALSHMGASVVSGITVTKFLGVFVLLFAKSQLFEIYYFRMYMFMLLWGALTGLVFLPVLLSFVGPPYYPVKDIPSPYDHLIVPTQPPKDDKGLFLPKEKPSQPPVSPPTQYTSQYPTLPTVNDVEERLNNGQQQQQQEYPAPTYPGQNEYQKRGLPYNNSADETTKLINH